MSDLAAASNADESRRPRPLVTIVGLRRQGSTTEDLTFSLPVPDHWMEKTIDDLAPELKNMGFSAYSWITTKDEPQHDTVRVKVVSGSQSSCYSIEAGPELRISANESPAQWWFKHTENQTTRDTIGCNDSILNAYGRSISFQRTLRVPDDGKEYPLPPSLGTFPLFPVEGFASKLPPAIRAQGGYILPMYQREALWLAFNSDRQALPTALKVSVGGINAITGLPKGKEDVDMQDYLCDQQPWLDGVATQPGVVKQFVAVDVNEGYTVEEQVTGRNSQATLQIDVFPSFPLDFTCRQAASAGQSSALDQLDSLAKVNVPLGSFLHFRSSKPLSVESAPISSFFTNGRESLTLQVGGSGDDYKIFVKTLTGRIFSIALGTLDTTVREIKEIIQIKCGTAPEKQSLYFDGKRLEDECTLPDYGIVHQSVLHVILRMGEGGDKSPDPCMGIAAGGTIAQRIYEDRHDPRIYDYVRGVRFYVHAINAAMWRSITGSDAPITPVTRESYSDANLPWFTLYNEPSGVKQSGAGFFNLKSIKEVDKAAILQSHLPTKLQGELEVEENLDINTRWQRGTGYTVDLSLDNVAKPYKPIKASEHLDFCH